MSDRLWAFAERAAGKFHFATPLADRRIFLKSDASRTKSYISHFFFHSQFHWIERTWCCYRRGRRCPLRRSACWPLAAAAASSCWALPGNVFRSPGTSRRAPRESANRAAEVSTPAATRPTQRATRPWTTRVQERASAQV